jgi:hypothetical protein
MLCSLPPLPPADESLALRRRSYSHAHEVSAAESNSGAAAVLTAAVAAEPPALDESGLAEATGAAAEEDSGDVEA